MNRKLVITKIEDRAVTAVLENEEVTELHVSDKRTEAHRVGNIYVGKVKNIVPNIQAAFVEIANGVECYYSIPQNPNPHFTQKIGKKPLCIGDELLVQIEKEAVKTKVPTVTSNLSFTGKYVVLTSGIKKIGISSKITGEKRKEMQEAVSAFQSEAYGFIVRTNAKDVPVTLVERELEELAKVYVRLLDISASRKVFSCLFEAPLMYLSNIRDIYQEGLTDIVVEEALFEEVEQYLKEEQPEDLQKLTCYADRQLPLYKLYSLESVISRALSERVWMKSGAYLVIQPTEALTVIDVNTGKCVAGKKDDGFYMKINLEAAREAAKQIRLRNLSGIILIDFINMKSKERTKELLEFFEKELRKDPVQTILVDMTQLQLVEVTRKKVRKPLKEVISQEKG
jgi:ribonuclease G